MNDSLTTLIQLALSEDVGAGDITTAATIDPTAKGTAVIRAKEALVVAGLDVARAVCATVDPELSWRSHMQDGDHLAPGKTLAAMSGRLASILIAERTALNFLQRLSGIATLTARFIAAVKGTNVQILDTRKTTPGWRSLERAAVRAGGGANHRQGLFDRYLIKNNHITAAGGIARAIEQVKQKRQPNILLEVEARTLAEVDVAVAHGVDIILLDNMTVTDVRTAVKQVAGRATLEVSGNITLASVRSYAETGVDCISVGSLTHSAPAADLHLIVMER